MTLQLPNLINTIFVIYGIITNCRTVKIWFINK